MADDKPWVMPAWMEPYRGLIRNTGGNPIEGLMNDKHTNGFNNAIRSALIVSVESQVMLLGSLQHRNMLRPMGDGLYHTLEQQLRREQAVIEAMHRRPWWRVGILLRRPWRAPYGPRDIHSFWGWLRYAHDCQDPMVGCSCSGGFRFPSMTKREATP